jgi:hypothetical protein
VEIFGGKNYMLSRKTIRFCPVCGGAATPEKKTPYSVCTLCGLEFCAFKKPVPVIRVPVVGGHMHRQECAGADGRGKICHASVAEAYARALTLEDIPHRHRAMMEFYLCRWCNKIHMGHGGKAKKNAAVSYTNEQAKILYEQAIENGELTPYPEDWFEKVQK